MAASSALKRGKKSQWIRTRKKMRGSGKSWELVPEEKRRGNSESAAQQQYIYVITNPLIDGWVKVGMSFDPYSRVKQLNTGNPEDLAVAFCLELKEGQTDKDFHPALRNASDKSNREWFRMSEDDAVKTILSVSARYFAAPNQSNQ